MFRQLGKIFSSGDVSQIGELFSDDYIDHQKPEFIEFQGREEFEAIVRLVRTTSPDLKVEIVEPVIAEANMVVGRMRWISQQGIRETIEMLRVENDKFVEHWGTRIS